MSLSDRSGKYLLAVFEMNDKEKQGSEALIDRANIKDAFNVLHECISEHLKLHPVKCSRCGAFINVIERDKKGDILGKTEIQLEKIKAEWTMKYKRSIDCKNPKGFSQKQYCKNK